MDFEWNDSKNAINISKHNLSFDEAQEVFFDENKVIIVDKAHSSEEKRYFCIGKTQGGIATVRFTKRNGRIRIFGAGYWREGRKLYEQQHN